MEFRWLKLVGKFLVVGVVLTILPQSRSFDVAAASSETVWRIGTFDESPAEFNGDALPDSAPAFIIGKSKPEKDWYAFQPGSANGEFGNRPHPLSIQFELSEQPSGFYSMKLGLMVEHHGVPVLDVEINGAKGRFYQHPKLIYSYGDRGAAWDIDYSYDSISFDFPARLLHKGTNRIALTAIDEDAEKSPPGAIASIESGIVYDALELSHQTGGKFDAEAVAVQAIPTIYYRGEQGHLKESVDVFVRSAQKPKLARIELSLGGKSFSQPLLSDRDFGEQRVEFEVPEFSAPSAATVSVFVNGHKRRFEQELKPAKKWTIFLVPNEHLDVGYTDFEGKVAEVHSRVIDEAMQLIKQHPDFRYTLDGSWEAEQFLDGRTEAERDELYRMVADGKIFVPPQYASLLIGFPTAEGLIRSLYPGAEYHKQHGGPLDYASITDVPAYTWSYASVLAATGLKYFIAGSNNDTAPALLFGRLNEKSPFWWEGPDGKKILMWYSRHYAQVESLFRMPPHVAQREDALPIFLQMYEHPGYKSDAVLLFGTQNENTDLAPQQAELADAWNSTHAYPKLKYSGFSEALDYITGQFGDSIPTFRGDGGSYWEAYNTANAAYVALERENERRAVSAEKLSTISALVNTRIAPEKPKLDEIWKDITLMDEHTWDSGDSVSAPRSRHSMQQQASKEAFANEAHLLVNHVLNRSMGVIVDSMPAPQGTLVVFNSLNWKRGGLVDFDLAEGWQIIDKSTKQVVPYEVESTDHTRRIRFLATDVPALGYKNYELRRTQEVSPAMVSGTGTTLESPYYRVELDPASASVRSIYDKELKRELVNTSSPFRFGQYLYVTGADQPPNRLLAFRTTSPTPELTPHGAVDGRLVSVTRTPFGTVARLEGSTLDTPRLETEIVLFDNQKKIEFINRIHKEEVFTKEAAYFAFPFALEKPEFRYEIQTGSVNPAVDMLPGGGLEWFSVQHWISAQQDGMAATVLPLDAPMVTLGDIARGTFPESFEHPAGAIFSYVMSNYHYDNWPGGQGGDFTFRYVVTSSAATDQTALSRMGWEELTPLEIDQVTSQDKAVNLPEPLDGVEGSFMEVSKPDVLLETWKQAEDGKGTILRFLDIGETGGPVKVTTPLLNVESAWLCTAFEDNQQPLAVSGSHAFTFDIKPHEIITVRLQGSAVPFR